MNKEQYEKFYNILINSPRIEQHDFEKGAKSLFDTVIKTSNYKSLDISKYLK